MKKTVYTEASLYLVREYSRAGSSMSQPNFA